MLIILSFITACILILSGVLLLMSPGKSEQFFDPKGNILEGSISEKIKLTINGIKQGMFIKSKDKNFPVLLFLHGGIPEYYLTKKYPTGLETFFTVVWWEQRGSGLSFNANQPIESITLDQLISDTREVTNYLRKRFGQNKIYLMAHSGGTFIGIQVAAQAPELYHAYIGVAQMTDQLESERLAYKYMLNQFKISDNKRMVRKLEVASEILTGPIPGSYLSFRDEGMHSLGIGTTRGMSSILKEIFLPSLTFREYTIPEKINLWRGKSIAGVHPLWDTMQNTDLTQQLSELSIPVYFFHGVYDYTVSYPLAKKYFEELKAPVKGFYTFEQSAHSPFLEEPEKMQQIFKRDIFRGMNILADKN